MNPYGPGGRLFDEILQARQRVYAIGEPTPLESSAAAPGVGLYLKREDLSPIHAYKWRGAYNRMALLTPEEREDAPEGDGEPEGSVAPVAGAEDPEVREEDPDDAAQAGTSTGMTSNARERALRLLDLI